MRFPDGFLWGAATAAHQIEGDNVNNDWWRAEEAGLLPHRSGDACDSWNRWPEDIQLLSQIGLNAYRLSIEWARVEPQPGHFDQTALDTYRRQLESLKRAGIEPMVTLHHFTSPRWLADQGGWRNPDVVSRLAKYADHVARQTGDLVRWWVTINEPSILGLKAYIGRLAVAGPGAPSGAAGARLDRGQLLQPHARGLAMAWATGPRRSRAH
ncbi:MAG: family 1 glycosylhydrolase [Chloroflexi bacterium]|nr:family 1 glycosylhydrolase [Chloroflexota bacterium]